MAAAAEPVSSRWERTKVTTRGGREWPRRRVLRGGCGSVGEKVGAGGACGLSPGCASLLFMGGPGHWGAEGPFVSSGVCTEGLYGLLKPKVR